MCDERVSSTVADGVLRLELHRPEKRNAIDAAMVHALSRELAAAQLDGDVRVVELRGAGKDFCAGADLAELLESANKSPDENRATAQDLGNVFIAIRKLPKPVVAVVHGRALAGGCGLATACDLVLASEEASFGYPEVQRGFVPAMVMAMLRRTVGEKAAFELVATGRILTAREAEQLGLVSRVFSEREFEDGVRDMVARLAASSPSALAFIKRQFYEIEGRSFEDAVALGAQVNAVARATPDFKQAVESFLKK